jgi:hypothetical protein
MPFLTAHPGAAPVLVTAVVLGVLRFTFPKDSRHRLELWKAILEHRRRRWQVAECRREVGRPGKTGQPDRPLERCDAAVTDQPGRPAVPPAGEQRLPPRR